jgi:hypothetical protein
MSVWRRPEDISNREKAAADRDHDCVSTIVCLRFSTIFLMWSFTVVSAIFSRPAICLLR